MNAVLVAQLIVQYGLPLAQQIVAWVEAGKNVTQADFDSLNTLAKYRSADALAAAGIKIVNGVVTPVS